MVAAWGQLFKSELVGWLGLYCDVRPPEKFGRSDFRYVVKPCHVLIFRRLPPSPLEPGGVAIGVFAVRWHQDQGLNPNGADSIFELLLTVLSSLNRFLQLGYIISKQFAADAQGYRRGNGINADEHRRPFRPR